MTVLAIRTVLWLALGLVVFVIVALPLLALSFAVFAGGADDIADVQRFVELTEDARRLVPPSLPLFDSDKAAAMTAAILRFHKKKGARRALWASRDGRQAVAIAQPTTAQQAPSVPLGSAGSSSLTSTRT